MNGPLKYSGGKHYIAEKIVSLFPQHLHYVEPFFGGGSVLLTRDPNDRRLWLPPHQGVSEVVNDINGLLTNFWRVLQNPQQFAEFKRHVEAVPLSRVEWNESHIYSYENSVQNAVAFFINCRQSRAGMMKDFSTMTRNRLRRRMNAGASEWLSAIEGLEAIHSRLIRVVVENIDAVELIQREDEPTTLFYCDPPYLHETRTTKDLYQYEMTVDQHIKLLDVLINCKGMVMLSAYPNKLYDQTLYPKNWTRKEFIVPNHAAGGKRKKKMKEVLWMSPNCSSTSKMPIFSRLGGK